MTYISLSVILGLGALILPLLNLQQQKYDRKFYGLGGYLAVVSFSLCLASLYVQFLLIKSFGNDLAMISHGLSVMCIVAPFILVLTVALNALCIKNMGMMIEYIIEIIIGIIIIVVGIMIYKGNINLIHNYHYLHVAEKDKPVFCRKMGLRTALVGLGVLIMPILNYFVKVPLGYWVGFIVIIISIIITLMTIKKYNGSIFG